MILLATALYVVNLQKNMLEYNSNSNLDLPFYKQGLRHTMISALANISNGGDIDVLATDLDEFNNFTTEHSYSASLDKEYNLLDTGYYQNGIWISQNSSGQGIAGAFATYSINASTTIGIYNAQFDVNVTSMIGVSGYYSRLGGSEKQATLTCRIYNEGKAALAESFIISYEDDGNLEPENWILVDASEVVDLGDGSYTITFNVFTEKRADTLLVFVSCLDQRGILVQTQFAPILQ